MDDLVRVTFSVFFGLPYESEPILKRRIADSYRQRFAGQLLTVEPTDVKGEFRITGLFPREFAEARSYE